MSSQKELRSHSRVISRTTVRRDVFVLFRGGPAVALANFLLSQPPNRVVPGFPDLVPRRADLT
jgi:hypothetical protein